MQTAQRAINNTIMMMVSQAITWTGALVLTGALGRYLGGTDFGNLYLAMSFGAIFSVIVEFGLNQQFVRAVARDRALATEYLVNSIAIKLALSLIAYVLILVIAHLLRYPPRVVLTIAIYGLILPISGTATALSAVFQAFESMKQASIATVLEKLFATAAGLLLLHLGYGAPVVAAVFVVGSAISVVWQFMFVRRLIGLQIAIDTKIIRMLAIGALPFFAYWALGSIYFRIDAVLLSKFGGAEVVGWYGAAYKLFDTLVFLPGIVSTAVMFPILSRLSVDSREGLKRALAKALDAMILIGLPLCVGLLLLADPIIRFIYAKPEFEHAVQPLRWLAVGLFFLYLNSVLSVAVFSINQERKMITAAALATVLNFGLNLILIPRYEENGAAAMTVITELFLFAYLVVVLPNDLFSTSNIAVFARTSLAVAAMSAVIVGLRGQSLYVLVAAGGAVYCLGVVLFRAVTSADLALIRETVLRRRGTALTETEIG